MGDFVPKSATISMLRGITNFTSIAFFLFGEGKIIHLRLDPPDGATFSPEYIKIKEIEPLPYGKWMVFGGLDVRKAGEKSLQFEVKEDEASILLPLTTFEGSKASLVSFSLKLRTSKPNPYGEIVYQEGSERRSFAFDLIADGNPHYYNICPGWIENVFSAMLILRHCQGEGELSDVEVGVEPKGEELEITYFGVDGIARAGKPFTLLLQMKNLGAPLKEVKAELLLPKEIRILKRTVSQRISDIDFGGTQFLRWTAICKRIGEFKATVKIGFGKVSQEFSSTLKVTKAPSLSSADYPPPPKIAKGDWEVGVYYFPGWPSNSNWLPIKNWGRKPLLGYYREGNPEVMDWQIKWALEHGITFFIFNWYWVQGNRILEHALHDAFLKSRYGNLMKFSLLWANHNLPKHHPFPTS